MSKGSKTRNKAQRLNKKRAEKAAKAARYQALAGTDTNTKSRQRAIEAVVLVNNFKHPNGACGNIGCLKCNPNGAKRPSSYLRKD